MFCGDLDHLVSYVKSEDLGMVRNHILLAPTNTKPLFFQLNFPLFCLLIIDTTLGRLTIRPRPENSGRDVVANEK